MFKNIYETESKYETEPKPKRTALIGIGHFGRFHLKNIASLENLEYGIDIDTKKKGLLEEYERKFLNTDLTRAIIIERDKEGNPISHKIKKDLPEIRELTKKTDVWNIVAPSPLHFDLMLLGLELGKDVFVEKPPAERVSEIEYILERFPDSKIGVDYIEMSHPVVQAVKDEMLKEKFEPSYYFHHRSKDLRENIRGLGGGEGSRIILDDLVHDISEVEFWRKSIEKDSLAEGFEVNQAEIQRWDEIGYPYSADVKAGFTLLLDNNQTKVEVEGSFAAPEVRQFLIVDEGKDVAYFGNTLTREQIKPIAAKVSGKENIEYLKQKIKGMEILNNEMQDKILKEIDAKILDLQAYEPNSLKTMLKNFYESDTKKDLICSLDQALNIQKIAEEVYKKAKF